MKKGDWLPLAARIFVGLIFAYAGFAKLMEPIENFRGAVSQYTIIPYPLVGVIAQVMPWFELVLGTFIVLSYAPRLVFPVGAGVCLALLVLVVSTPSFWSLNPEVCGCFGQSGLKLSLHQMFFLNFLNFSLCLKLFAIKDHPLSLDRMLAS